MLRAGLDTGYPYTDYSGRSSGRLSQFLTVYPARRALPSAPPQHLLRSIGSSGRTMGVSLSGEVRSI